MISLSQRQALLTRLLYGQEFIDELAGFLKREGISSILECGCGDGYTLNGLAKKGFSGLGIDSDEEMISLAHKDHGHPNVEYRLMSWLNLHELNREFDLVMCRGGSIVDVEIWGKTDFDKDEVYGKIVESVNQMWQRVHPGGLLYIDAIPQREIDNSGGYVRIKTEHIDIGGTIVYDWQRRIRYMRGSGTIAGHEFKDAEYRSYLMRPNELEDIIRAHNPVNIWRLDLANERYYDSICARKRS